MEDSIKSILLANPFGYWSITTNLTNLIPPNLKYYFIHIVSFSHHEHLTLSLSSYYYEYLALIYSTESYHQLISSPSHLTRQFCQELS